MMKTRTSVRVYRRTSRPRRCRTGAAHAGDAVGNLDEILGRGGKFLDAAEYACPCCKSSSVSLTVSAPVSVTGELVNGQRGVGGQADHVLLRRGLVADHAANGRSGASANCDPGPDSACGISMALPSTTSTVPSWRGVNDGAWSARILPATSGCQRRRPANNAPRLDMRTTVANPGLDGLSGRAAASVNNTPHTRQQ